MLRSLFGFADHQEKATYGFGYKLTLTMNSNNADSNTAEAIADAKVVIGTYLILLLLFPTNLQYLSNF